MKLSYISRREFSLKLFLLRATVISLGLISILTLSGTCFANNSPGALENLLGNLTTMHAHFHEVAQSPEGERTADGELFIQKPGKFYWENTSPSSEYFLSDGETLWHYQPDLLQATKSSLSGALDQTPLLLLSGKVADISELFSVSELSPGEFLLIPKNKNNNANQDNLIQSITLKFNAGKLNPGELESFSLKSALGQETTVTFSQVEWNLPIQASKFKFTLPPGSDLFEG